MISGRILATLCIICGAMCAAPSFAQASQSDRLINFSVDAGASTSTSPANNWDTATGISLGLVYRLTNNSGIRLAVEQYKFSGTSTAGTYTRMPIFLGGRFYFWNFGDIWSHADLGMEMSLDQKSSSAGVANDTQTNVGGAALYGLLYEISNHLFMGADIKIHLNKDKYWSYGIYLGMVF